MGKLPERLQYIYAIEKPELRIEISARIILKEVFGNQVNDFIEKIEVVNLPDSYLLSIAVKSGEVAELLRIKVKEIEYRVSSYSRLKVKVRIVMGAC
jgi:poly-beta-hydroxyalkanoate depolymerase